MRGCLVVYPSCMASRIASRTGGRPLGRAQFATAARRVALYVLDMAVVVLFIVLYYVGRGLAPHRPEFATDNALRIIDFERALGVFAEQSWQSAALENQRLVDFANFTYQHLHMPLIVVLGGAFFLANTRKHRVLRNAILLSAFVAIPVYHLVPVTPPRLLAEHGYSAFGFVDTIPATDRLKPAAFTNWYAAMPSYHYGWNALITVGVFWCWRHWAPRVAAVAFSGVMWWAIIVTGNHYFLDLVLGAVFVMPCLLAALAFERWADRNPNRVARFTFRIGDLRLPF